MIRIFRNLPTRWSGRTRGGWGTLIILGSILGSWLIAWLVSLWV